MEIIIGMAIAFALGAYVRKPFKFFEKKEDALEQTEKTVSAEEIRKQREYEKQLDAMYRYTGEEDAD